MTERKTEKMRQKGNRWKIYIGIWTSVIGLNVAAWNSTALCDWYRAHIFRIWVDSYGRMTGLAKGSVGERLIALAVIMTLTIVLLSLVAVFWKQSRGLVRRYQIFYAWFVQLVCVIMTLNCSMLYHAGTFEQMYFRLESKEKDTTQELITLRNKIVTRCNELAKEVERDPNGDICYEKDINEQSVIYMQQLGKRYEQLAGYYPKPKPLRASDLMSQQYMQGYYFPFSMEANYNDVMYVMNKPATMCHELAHLHGFIYEDEANFISYLACVASDDPFFEYSGYLSVLYYVEQDYKRVSTEKEQEIQISDQVKIDNMFLKQSEWDRINKKAWFKTKQVRKVSAKLTDASLKANGVKDGQNSYSRVVHLLLLQQRRENKSELNKS